MLSAKLSVRSLPRVKLASTQRVLLSLRAFQAFHTSFHTSRHRVEVRIAVPLSHEDARLNLEDIYCHQSGTHSHKGDQRSTRECHSVPASGSISRCCF